jgi:hypothetical protein
MSKLKKEIKRLKKRIRRDNKILITMKHFREARFNQLCTMRGKVYYRENPLHPKVLHTSENKPGGLNVSGIQNVIASFKEGMFNNVGKLENKLREIDAKIKEAEGALTRKREMLEDLKGMAK